MRRVAVCCFAVVIATTLGSGPAVAAEPSPGASGAGDPYFPLDGNGGYDVEHYHLDVTYDPDTDHLTGVTTIRAHATHDLSAFNLDLDGLTVGSITVNGADATWSRGRGELTVTPTDSLPEGELFTTVVEYAGVPRPGSELDGSGFMHTDDGTVVAGEPHVAASWYPVNDHPSDKASYAFDITVPQGLEALANGELTSRRDTDDGWTTWAWRAQEPMASYLTTATIGEFELDHYRADGIAYWDAIDPDLLTPLAVPRTGKQYAVSQQTADFEASYKRLSRRIDVPKAGGSLAFSIARETEPGWDFVFVEARTVGRRDWTTLPDRMGHTTRRTRYSCPSWLRLHPVLRRYQTDDGRGTCAPRGTTGRWSAASGASDGWERWRVNLDRFAGRTAQVSITYASDGFIQERGVVVDDIVAPDGASSSFEDDGATRDGWRSLRAPRGSPPNPNSWIVGTESDLPPSTGDIARSSLARQPEIIAFLADTFGDYPFSSAGGIVDDVDMSFALENQTRPIYSKFFFSDQVSGDAVVVHELAHQWYGDSLTVQRWRHIWLNEGFATYAEWLWSEEEGRESTQELFDLWYHLIPADESFWDVRIGNPGPDELFSFAVYVRGAMTLHQLRLAVGEEDFFTILRQWAERYAGGHVTTHRFVRLAEEISGEELSPLFRRWLFTHRKPAATTTQGRTTTEAPSPSMWGKRLEAPLRR